MNIIECDSTSTGIGKVLSNLTPHPFVLDGLNCASMEGALQSFKFSDKEMAAELRGMYGYKAFKRGQDGNRWKDGQRLFWNGKSYQRLTSSYHGLLDRAYDALFEQNVEFQAALAESDKAVLVHTRGKHDPQDSVLTHWEYIYQLYRLRAKVQQILADV
jgi:hypothetical protein